MIGQRLMLLGLLCCFTLVSCGGEEKKNSKVDLKNAGNDSPSNKSKSNSPEIEQFLINYSPPKEISDKVGTDSRLTYSLKVKTDDFGGDYTFFDCLDSACVTKHTIAVIKCDNKRNCQAFDTNNAKIGTPDHIWTFAYLWAPIYNPRTRKYDSWTGLDLHFVNPDSLEDGFHDQYNAAQFEDLNGNKSDLKVYHFKN